MSDDLEEYTGKLFIPKLEKIRVAKIFPDAKLPTRKHATDAGMDVYAWFDEGTYERLVSASVASYTTRIIHTGVAVEILPGYAGFFWPKSKSDYLIGGGVVDAGYQGELLVKIINPTNKNIQIEFGQAIAQLVIQPIETPRQEEITIEELRKEKTARAETGGIVRQLYTDLFPPEDITK